MKIEMTFWPKKVNETNNWSLCIYKTDDDELIGFNLYWGKKEDATHSFTCSPADFAKMAKILVPEHL